MTVESTHLGKQCSYPQHYDPSVLVAVPRHLNRVQYSIADDSLPFFGLDIWHAYEFSFLIDSGVPVAAILKIGYPANSPFLVESKSLKLYLNSYNMDKFGKTPQEGMDLTVSRIKADLSTLLNCTVEVSCFDHTVVPAPFDFTGYTILESFVDIDVLHCTDYSENPQLLQPGSLKGEISWGTHLLRSNCKITHQPDWGALYINMKGKVLPAPESFLQYIISLRNENHFHEEICEMVFKRVSDRFNPETLTITCLYTRRGGIDICPVRTSSPCLPPNLSNVDLLDKVAFRQ